MRIQYNGKSKILIRLTELVNQKADAEDMEQTAADLQKEIDEKADKSAIPTVGDGVLSVQRNGKSVGTFSANAAENAGINIPVPEKVSELENDAGYGTYTKPATGIPKSDLASGVQASLGKADTALQKHQDISGKLDKTGDASNTTVTFSAASARENVKTGEKLSVIVGKIAKWFADLKTVAFTGSYNDLANKPTIPDISGKQDKLTAGTNITISGNTISAKDTTYTSKSAVSGGTDVSLVTTGEKAIWNAKTSNVGTITGIKMNGASKGTSGVVDLGTVITAHQDISGKQDKSTAVTHTANTAVGSTAKPVYIAADGKATPITHSVNSDVPSNAKFTDTVYTHPTTAGNKHIPAGGSSGQILRWSADGTAVWGADNNTTYGDATQSAHGLMTAADKKKLDGMDLTKYLPKSGGVMTGNIDMQTNKKDILVGTHKATTSDGTAVAGGTINTDKKFVDLLPTMRSYIGTYNCKTSSRDDWFDLISVRHRNGYTDGSHWGMMMYAPMFGGDLHWDLNTDKDVWQGDRTLLDSVNYTRYALAKDGTAVAATRLSTARKINTIAFDGTEDITIPRSRSLVHQATGTNGSTGYVAVATLTVKATYCNLPGFIRYRNRGRAIVDLTFRFKNASTNDPELDFARMDFDVNDAERAYLSKSDTATWTLYISKAEKYDGIEIMDCQPPTGIDIAFTNAHAPSLPSGTVAFTQHNRANESSTVAAAKTLTDSGWIDTTRNTSFTATSTVKCRKYGQLVEVRGEVTFNSTYGSPTVCTLPAGYRPATVVQACGITPSGKQYMIKADTSGVISFGSDSGSTFVKGTTYRVDLTYLLG